MLSSRARALLLFIVSLTICISPPARGQDTTQRYSWQSPALPAIDPEAFYERLRRVPGLLGTDRPAIDAAVRKHPEILRSALERLSYRADPRVLLHRPDASLIMDFRRDLLRRAMVAATAGRPDLSVWSVQGRSDLFVGDMSERATDTDLSIFAAAARAQDDHQLIIRPLCPSGVATRRPGGLPECLEGDKWQVTTFRAVLPIHVDGRRVCTGTLIDGKTLLTAAHCVVEYRDKPETINRHRIAVGLADGTTVSLASNPKVPAPMLRPCVPPAMECPDYEYDFAILVLAKNVGSSTWTYGEAKRLRSAGRLAVTIAGYGFSNISDSASTNGLFVGPQEFDLATTETAFQWDYDFAIDARSSTCGGDSGGPIFAGSPRQPGDKLAIVGVLSRIVYYDAVPAPDAPETEICRKTTAAAVNLSMPDIATSFCALTGNQDAFCQR